MQELPYNESSDTEATDQTTTHLEELRTLFLPVLLLCGGQNYLALISTAEHCAGYAYYHVHSDSGDFLS